MSKASNANDSTPENLKPRWIVLGQTLRPVPVSALLVEAALVLGVSLAIQALFGPVEAVVVGLVFVVSCLRMAGVRLLSPGGFLLSLLVLGVAWFVFTAVLMRMASA